MHWEESETDSLEVSADSDSQEQRILERRVAATAAAAEAQDREAELQEYSKSLGVDGSDPGLAWIISEAFDAPLPGAWAQYTTADHRVYFYNQLTEESTWRHPMDSVYRELLTFVMGVRAETSVERRAQAVRDHLVEVHRRALASLEGWSGPYPCESGQYYFCERSGVSTWFSPIDAWEYELAVRHSVLHRSLLSDPRAATDEVPAPEVEASGGDSALVQDAGLDSAMLMKLSLPLGLARRDPDGQASPASPTHSSRSFYTARDSCNSGRSGRLGEVLSREDPEEMEVTFGRTRGVQMPVF